MGDPCRSRRRPNRVVTSSPPASAPADTRGSNRNRSGPFSTPARRPHRPSGPGAAVRRHVHRAPQHRDHPAAVVRRGPGPARPHVLGKGGNTQTSGSLKIVDELVGWRVLCGTGKPCVPAIRSRWASEVRPTTCLSRTVDHATGRQEGCRACGDRAGISELRRTTCAVALPGCSTPEAYRLTRSRRCCVTRRLLRPNGIWPTTRQRRSTSCRRSPSGAFAEVPSAEQAKGVPSGHPRR